VELAGAPTCDVQMEHSYLVDFSKSIIQWVKGEGYALLDVNLFPKPHSGERSRHAVTKSNDELSKEVMVYLWDNYISLSDAHRVILIGHEGGTAAIAHLCEQRANVLMKIVKGVIQVIGHARNPYIPKVTGETLRQWYYKHSLVILPSQHRLFLDYVKITKGHGKIVKFDETKPLKLLILALPVMQKYIKEELSAA